MSQCNVTQSNGTQTNTQSNGTQINTQSNVTQTNAQSNVTQYNYISITKHNSTSIYH